MLTENGVKAPFKFSPSQADIAAHKSTTFKVYFLPQHEQCYFNARAMAHVFVKTNRTFRLVNDEAFIPPWHVDVQLRGHTFPASSEQFLADVDMLVHQVADQDHVPQSGSNGTFEMIKGEDDDNVGRMDEYVDAITSSMIDTGVHKTIEFPASHFGGRVYQTIALRNSGDTPVQYEFSDDPTGVFSIKPASGLIARNEFVLVAIRFHPPARDAAANALSLDAQGHIVVAADRSMPNT
jgi:hypothetical protein